MRRLVLAAGVVVAAGVAFALAMSSTRAGSARSITFATTSPQKLAAGGISLSAPHGSLLSAAAGEAAAGVASRDFGGDKVLEYHYAYCLDTQDVPSIAEDCWAVSLDPSGLEGGGTPSTGPPSPASYLLALVNPATDTVLVAQSD